MIKLILFDWGDVCGFYNLDILNNYLKKLGYNYTLVDSYFKEFKPRFDRDQITEKEFWENLSRKLNYLDNWKMLAKNNQKNLKINKHLLNYIKKLKTTAKIALLSNMDKTSIRAIKEKISLKEYFDKVYFSSEFKTGKLEKNVVDKIFTQFKVNSNEVLFIDDYVGNVEKAKDLGMQTIQFKRNKDLMLKLKKLLKNSN